MMSPLTKSSALVKIHIQNMFIFVVCLLNLIFFLVLEVKHRIQLIVKQSDIQEKKMTMNQYVTDTAGILSTVGVAQRV